MSKYNKFRTAATILLVIDMLISCNFVNATVISLNDMPLINQRNAAYDRNTADGNQNGENWCVPVASVSTLLWLANTYNRPKLIPVGADGKQYTTDQFVEYMATRWFNTNDQTGTSEKSWALGLWGYLKASPYRWTMDVYSDPSIIGAFEGPLFSPHASVQDLFDEMKAGEDDPTAAVMLAYQHVDAFGKLTKHAVDLQQISDEKDAFKRYPGKIMDPYFGRLDDIGFDATQDMNTQAKLWDFIAWRDVYVAIAVAPVPEPQSLALLIIGLSLLILMKRRRRII